MNPVRRWFWIALVGLLFCAGCETLGFADKDTSVKPKPVTPAEAGAPAKVAWRIDIGATDRLARLSPVVVGDRIYAASEGGNLVAVSLDGRVLWQTQVKMQVIGAVGADDQLVVIGGKKGELAAFDAHTGKVLWQATAASEVVAPPIPAPSAVVLRTLDGRIFGLNRIDGKRKWVYQRILPTLILRSAAPMNLASDYVFIGYPGGKLIALHQDRGGLVMEESVSTPRGDNELERLTDISSKPIVQGQEVCVSAYQGRTGCFSLRTGNALWFRDISSSAGLDLDSRAVYVAADTGFIVALDRDLGTEKWRSEVLAGDRLVRPVVVGNVVVVGDSFGFLRFYSAVDGKPMGGIAVDGTALTAEPALLPDGRILVQTTGGRLIALTP